MRLVNAAIEYQVEVPVGAPLKAAGCERIFSEKASGKSSNGRQEFGKLTKVLLSGDIVWSPNSTAWLARADLHNIVGELKERGCGFVSLGDSWGDSTSDTGRLILAIMVGVAEFDWRPRAFTPEWIG